MGELKVDLDRLRRVAAAVRDAADHIADITWPQLDPGAMRDSAVSTSTAPTEIATHASDLVTRMRAWASDAHTSVVALKQTESLNAERLDP